MTTLLMDPLFADVLRKTLEETRAPAEVLPRLEGSLAQIERLEGCISEIVTSRPNENGFEVVSVRIAVKRPVEGASTDNISNGDNGRLTSQQIAELRRAASGGFKVRYSVRRNKDRTSTVLNVSVLCEKCAKCQESKDGQPF